TVPTLLQGTVGPAEPGAGNLLPASAAGLLRRAGFGAGHRLASGGFLVAEEVPGLSAGRGDAGSLHDLADPPAGVGRNAPRRVSVGAEDPGERRIVGGQERGSGCHDAGSERGD